MAVYTDGDWHFDVNREVTSVDEELYTYFADVLVAAGWTVVQRSDGSTVHSDGSQNDTADWSNGGAWEVYLDPSGAGGRYLIMQRNTSAWSPRNCRAWLTQRGAAAPSGGGATTAPASADQSQIIGSGGGFESNFWSNSSFDGLSRVHMAAKAAPSGNSGNVYPFYISVFSIGGTTDIDFCAVLACETPDDGTIGDANAEPWVCLDDVGDNTGSAWYEAGLAGESYVSNGITMVNLSVVPSMSPYSSAYYLTPLFAYDTGGTSQFLGEVLDMKRETTRGIGDTFNLATAGDAWIRFDYVFRWPTGVTPDFS